MVAYVSGVSTNLLSVQSLLLFICDVSFRFISRERERERGVVVRRRNAMREGKWATSYYYIKKKKKSRAISKIIF